MFDHEHWAQRVGLKGQQRVLGVYLARRFFGKQKPWDEEGELKAMVAWLEVLFACCCSFCDC